VANYFRPEQRPLLIPLANLPCLLWLERRADDELQPAQPDATRMNVFDRETRLRDDAVPSRFILLLLQEVAGLTVTHDRQSSKSARDRPPRLRREGRTASA